MNIRNFIASPFYTLRNDDAKSLIAKNLRDFFFKKSGEVAPQDTSDKSTYVIDRESRDTPIVERLRDYDELFVLDRYETARASWIVYGGDSRVKEGVRAIAVEATQADEDGHPYVINLETKGKPSKKQIRQFEKITKLNKMLNLEQNAYGIAKRMFMEGDAFREIVVDFKYNRVVELKEIPGVKEGYLMKAMLKSVTKELIGWALYRVGDIQRLERTFAPWQIVQFSFDKSGFYGEPGLGSAILDAKRLEQSEASMHVARSERSFLKFNHITPSASREMLIKQAKDHEKKLRDSRGRGIQTDYFSNHEMQMFDPKNEQLQNISDIEYFEDKLLTSIGRPKGLYAGYGDVINRSVLDRQCEGYYGSLSKITDQITLGYRKVIELELILNNILKDDLPFSIKWTEKSSLDWLSLVRGLSLIHDKGLSKKTYLSQLGFNPELEDERFSEENDKDWFRKNQNQPNQSAIGSNIDKNIKKADKQLNTAKGNSNPNSKESVNRFLARNGTRGHR